MKLLYKIIYVCLFSVSLFINADAQKKISVSKLRINSSVQNDFAPFLVDSVLYFTSNRKDELLSTYVDQNGEWLFRLYKAKLLPNGKFSKPTVYKNEALSKVHTSGITFADHNNIIAITQNTQTDISKLKKGKKNNFGIFFIDKNNNCTPFEYNSEKQKYSLGQASLSKDGKLMFFASNKKGGIGNSDIYMTKYENGKWTEPENLGEIVNTVEDERFPFYHNSGILYFASNGHKNKSDLDIYYTQKIDGVWQKPVALEKPINSRYNDFSCFISDDLSTGYFASDRNRADNIYKFTYSLPDFTKAVAQVEDNYCFNVFENGGFVSDTLPYIYRWDFGDGAMAKGLRADHCYEKDGDYVITLSVVDTLLHKELYDVAKYEISLKKTKQVYINMPETAEINENVKLVAENTSPEDINPDNYYWDFGDGVRAIGKKTSHKYTKKGEYIVKCAVYDKEDIKKQLCTSKNIIIK